MKQLITNMQSPNGNPVPNQFILTEGNKRTFQSYKTIIATIEGDNIILDKYYYDYSRTTTKYRNMFLGMDSKQVKDAILSGEIKLAQLNPEDHQA